MWRTSNLTSTEGKTKICFKRPSLHRNIFGEQSWYDLKFSYQSFSPATDPPSCCLSIPSSASLSPFGLHSHLTCVWLVFAARVCLTDPPPDRQQQPDRLRHTPLQLMLVHGKIHRGKAFEKASNIYNNLRCTLCRTGSPKCYVFTLNFEKEARSAARWYSIFSQRYFFLRSLHWASSTANMYYLYSLFLRHIYSIHTETGF